MTLSVRRLRDIRRSTRIDRFVSPQALWLAMLIAATAAPAQAFAGGIEVELQFDSCANAAPGKQVYVRTETLRTNQIPPYVALQDRFNVTSVVNGAFIQECSKAYLIRVGNVSRGVQRIVDRLVTNRSLREKVARQRNLVLPRIYKDSLERLRRNIDESPRSFHIRSPNGGGGVRGSLGLGLFEGSPAYVAFTSPAAGLTAGEVDIPFVVLDQGDGDYLELSARGIVFFRAPLSDFPVGELQAVSVPAELLLGDILWVFYLDSVGTATAKVFFPFEVPALDADSDATDDAFDVCPAVPDPEQGDSDGDEWGDFCDNCPAALNVSQADEDGDGVGGACDNCPAIPNSNQLDANRNGVGDACEVRRACSVDADEDIDRDDIALITAARNQTATGPADPRDPDRNNLINVLDARQCALRCDRAQCATR